MSATHANKVDAELSDQNRIRNSSGRGRKCLTYYTPHLSRMQIEVSSNWQKGFGQVWTT